MTHNILEQVTLEAADGLKLVGYHFASEEPQAAILVCPATGVTQKFYFSFCRWLSRNGYSAFTFDYRGLGESLGSSSLLSSKARLQDWGELDMPAALAWLENRYPSLPKHLIGHSAGGLLFGLMPNHKTLSSVISVAASIGYIDAIAMPERLVTYFLFKIYLPLAVALCGYLPAKRFNLAEDLPAGVARQWYDWCSKPGYVQNAFGREILTNYYAQIAIPMLVLNVQDDPVASAFNVSALDQLFPNAPIEKVCLVPAQFGLSRVGHMGFFREKNAQLWLCVIEWLKAKENPDRKENSSDI